MTTLNGSYGMLFPIKIVNTPQSHSKESLKEIKSIFSDLVAKEVLTLFLLSMALFCPPLSQVKMNGALLQMTKSQCVQPPVKAPPPNDITSELLTSLMFFFFDFFFFSLMFYSAPNSLKSKLQFTLPFRDPHVNAFFSPKSMGYVCSLPLLRIYADKTFKGLLCLQHSAVEIH